MAQTTSKRIDIKKILVEIKYSFLHPAEILKGKVFKNTAVLLSGDALARIISLLSLTLTVRALGAETFGILALAETYAKLIDRILNFQAWSGVIKFGAEAAQKGDKQLMGSIIRTGYLLDIGSALCGLAVAYFVAPAVGKLLNWHELVVSTARLYSFLILFNVTGTATGILRLTERFSLIATQRLVYSFTRLSAVLFVVFIKGSLKHFVLAWMLSECLGYLVLNLFAYKISSERKWTALSRGGNSLKTKQFISFVVWTNLSSTADVPVKFLDVFFVSRFVSIEAAGVYKVFQQISHVLKKPVEPLYQVVYPHFSTQVASKDFSGLVKSVLKAFFFLTVASALASLILIASSRWWFPTFFGDEFLKYTNYFVLYISVQAINAATLPVHPLFLALGLVRKNFAIQLTANLCFIVAAYYLGKATGFYGIIGALALHLFLTTGLKAIFSMFELSSGKIKK